MARFQRETKVLASPDRLDQTTLWNKFRYNHAPKASKNLSGEQKSRSKPKHLACGQQLNDWAIKIEIL